MRLTDFSDYALRALIYMNQKRELVTLTELSENLHISRNHLIKIANKLVKLGYVEAIRGRSGGLKINPSAGTLKVGDIVKSTEENFTMAECFGKEKSNCVYVSTCSLKHALNEALSSFVETLNRYSLNDITRTTRYKK